MMLLLVAIAVSFNLLVILWKFSNGRTMDATLDTGLLILVGSVFSGSFNALVVGTIASAIVSLYLLINPPKF